MAGLSRSAHQSEIQVLQKLQHPGIPQYLDSFETPTGFCLVQDYKEADSLSMPRHFSLEQIKQIAVSVLEILVYLQQQHPSVIHRDIKPENILVDRSHPLKVYLVDFGFARQVGEIGVSSVVKGTLGFMPPEQILNRQLTEASDLYSLGMTLLCLLTDTRSIEVSTLVDEQFRVNVKTILPNLNVRFVQWLKKMVAPSLEKRYPNAEVALHELKSIDSSNSKNLFSLRLLNPDSFKGIAIGAISIVGTLAVLQGSVFIKYLLTSTRSQTTRSRNSQLSKNLNNRPFSTEVECSWSSFYSVLSAPEDVEKQITLCNNAIEIEPRSYQKLIVKGYILAQMGRFQESFADLDRAEALLLESTELSLSKKYEFIFSIELCRGFSFIILGRYKEAVSALNRAVELYDFTPAADRESQISANWKGDPSLIVSLHCRGFALEKLGRLEEAQASYDKARAISPQSSCKDMVKFHYEYLKKISK